MTHIELNFCKKAENSNLMDLNIQGRTALAWTDLSDRCTSLASTVAVSPSPIMPEVDALTSSLQVGGKPMST